MYEVGEEKSERERGGERERGCRNSRGGSGRAAGWGESVFGSRAAWYIGYLISFGSERPAVEAYILVYEIFGCTRWEREERNADHGIRRVISSRGVMKKKVILICCCELV